MARNLVLYLALRLASWFVPALPVELAYRLAAAAGGGAYYLLRGPRAAITANLARVKQSEVHDPEIRKLARRAFQNDAKNWVDTLRIPHLSEQQIVDGVDVEGWQHVEDALALPSHPDKSRASGTGLIMVGMHLGNFDLVGQYIAIRGYRLTIPVERMQPERLFDFLLQLRSSKGINAVPIDRAPRELLRSLKDGEIVAIMTDRNLGGRGVKVPFFGAETALPHAAISLSRRTGAPVLVCGAIRRASGRFSGFVSSPVPMVRTENASQDERVNLARVAAVMEQYIAGFPDQWLMFTPLWPEGTDGNPTGTIGQQTEAAV